MPPVLPWLRGDGALHNTGSLGRGQGGCCWLPRFSKELGPASALWVSVLPLLGAPPGAVPEAACAPVREDGLSPSLHPTGTIWGTAAALLRAWGWGWCCVSRIQAGPGSSCLLGGVSPWGGEMPSVPGAGWRQRGQRGSKAHFAEAEAGLGCAGKGWGSLGSARGFGAGRGSPALGVCRAPCLGNGVEYRYRGGGQAGAGRAGSAARRGCSSPRCGCPGTPGPSEVRGIRLSPQLSVYKLPEHSVSLK